MNKNFVFLIIFFSFLTVFLSSAYGAPTKVGNGDSGYDLDGFEKLEKGKIVEARDGAAKKLKSLNCGSIQYLGRLIPEVEKADLYMTEKSIGPEQLAKMGAYTADGSGMVYARTYPQAHAPTRFFPAAKGLSKEKLISLHIHEALHRSLPQQVRENEYIVSEVTMAIVSPGSTRDGIDQKVSSLISPHLKSVPVVLAPVLEKKIFIPEEARVKNPSVFGLGYKSFSLPKENETDGFIGNPIKGMYTLQSHLYPFGQEGTAIGIGIDLSFLKTEKENQMGPMGLSARWLAYTVRGFDFELFGQAKLNTLSDEELQNSFLGRDVYTLGVGLSKKNDIFYISNELFYTGSSEVEEKIGNLSYTYEFGSVTGLKINAGGYYKNLHIGGFLEMLLSDNFKVSGGAFPYETGRNRVISIGPKLGWKTKNFGIEMYGRYLLDSTQNVDYEFLGNILEQGVGQGHMGSKLQFFF
jgi:hypothetical protein